LHRQEIQANYRQLFTPLKNRIMLKVAEISKVSEVQIVLADFIPLKLNVLGELSRPPIIWRIGNFHTSLLEMRISSTTHIFSSVKVVLSDSIIEHSLREEKKDITEAGVGIPIFEIPKSTNQYIIEDTDQHIIEEHILFNLFIGQSDVYISFVDTHLICSHISSGNANFLLTKENCFCGFGVNNLQDWEMTYLRDTLMTIKN
jgi:hypothetical protein